MSKKKIVVCGLLVLGIAIGLYIGNRYLRFDILFPAMKRFLSSNMRRMALVGEINNSNFLLGFPFSKADKKKFGTVLEFPYAQKIIIDDVIRQPGNVGQKVKNLFFKNRAPFHFNVHFNTGYEIKEGSFKGYNHPESIWFNVFFGGYEIDVPIINGAETPFGYRTMARGESGKDSDFDMESIIKLFIADWYYFSNYLYGVPETILRERAITVADQWKSIAYTVSKRVVQTNNGPRTWHFIEITGIDALTTYVKPGDAGLLEYPSVFSDIWIKSFIRDKRYIVPSDRILNPLNFFPVKMDGKFYLSWKKERDIDSDSYVYKTYFFGGSKNQIHDDADDKKTQNGRNNQFLNAQMKSVEHALVNEFYDLGF